MILFKNISWKNFLSTGNQSTKVDFTKNKTNLIVGTNGAGKSTILDALCFSLFGRSFRRINKPQLINSVNEKDCVVEVQFDIGTTNWKVIRGIKPSIFEIWKNDTLLDQASSSNDQQKWLEQNVLKMNYKSFTQIVILGSSTFVPFMQLSAAHRREVIEDLLDIRIFSAMNNLIKDKIRTQKEKIKSLDFKKENLKDKIKMQETFIEELENRGNANIDSNNRKITDLDSEISNHIEDNERLEKEVKELQSKLEEMSDIDGKLAKLNNLKGKLSQKVSIMADEHSFFTDNSVCPTCTQTIEEDFRLNKVKDVQNKLKELKSGYEELEKTIVTEKERERQFIDTSKEITKLNHDISQNNTRISLNRRQIRDLESEVQKITDQLKNRNIEHEKLEEFRKSLQSVFDELSKRKEEIVYYDFAYSLLKDDGVKTKIIKKYLPFINQQVNRYLQMMDFYINFEFDSEFNEYIRSPIHEDFSYASFSEGEKARIDLSLLFAWREVARLKNSANCNILMFDEVFDGSLDGFGADEFIKIIKYVVKDTNIFVISHKTGLDDKFDRTITFEKIKGFSRIKDDK
jgi:DNA repair exonuclease SbcCD ATPase subunit